jgi:seryl-tRNA synthetase
MLDDQLPDIPPEPLISSDAHDDEIYAMRRRTNGFIATLASDRRGHKNIERIDAVIAETQARHDRAQAVEDAKHRETTRLNDLYEHRYGVPPPPFASGYDDSFSRFVQKEKEKQEAVANAEAEREHAVAAEAKRAEREHFDRQRAAERADEIEARAFRQSMRSQLRDGAPGKWGAIRTGNDPSIQLGLRGPRA